MQTHPLPRKAVFEYKGQQTGFSLFETLIAAFIVAVAVAGVMRLHTHNLANSASNAELQRAYVVLSNMEQRFQVQHELSALDVVQLQAQAQRSGLRQVNVTQGAGFVGLSWRALDGTHSVQRGGCVVAAGFSCVQIRVV